jgi:hypothetical protein
MLRLLRVIRQVREVLAAALGPRAHRFHHRRRRLAGRLDHQLPPRRRPALERPAPRARPGAAIPRPRAHGDRGLLSLHARPQRPDPSLPRRHPRSPPPEQASAANAAALARRHRGPASGPTRRPTGPRILMGGQRLHVLRHPSRLACHSVIWFPQAARLLGHWGSLLAVHGVVVGPCGACKIGRVHGALGIIFNAEVPEALRGCS